jgi:hypothetical protein
MPGFRSELNCVEKSRPLPHWSTFGHSADFGEWLGSPKAASLATFAFYYANGLNAEGGQRQTVEALGGCIHSQSIELPLASPFR